MKNETEEKILLKISYSSKKKYEWYNKILEKKAKDCGRKCALSLGLFMLFFLFGAWNISVEAFTIASLSFFVAAIWALNAISYDIHLAKYHQMEIMSKMLRRKIE
jgi:hypothetical protein